MPKQPIQFRFDPNLPYATADAAAAARRRILVLESAYSAVRGWDVALAVRQTAANAGAPALEARIVAIVVGSGTFEGHASSTDAAAALRLAFNALQVQLEADADRARCRAAEWIGKVRMHLRQHSTC